MALVRTDLPGLPPPRRGKVRDVYDLGDRLLIVATDRLSAYDFVLTPGIPDKGRILHQMSVFWFERLAAVAPHHLLPVPPAAEPRVAEALALAPAAAAAMIADQIAGRSAVVRKARVVPFECRSEERRVGK